MAVTLALSGGGTKCAAQAGVLAVLPESGAAIRALVGVSTGGLVAVLYALGWSPPAISDFIAGTHLLELLDFDPSRRALLGQARFRARLTAAVGDRTFDDLAYPVTLVAVDLATGAEVELDAGRLADALVATMAMPGLLPPFTHNGRQFWSTAAWSTRCQSMWPAAPACPSSPSTWPACPPPPSRRGRCSKQPARWASSPASASASA